MVFLGLDEGVISGSPLSMMGFCDLVVIMPLRTSFLRDTSLLGPIFVCCVCCREPFPHFICNGAAECSRKGVMSTLGCRTLQILRVCVKRRATRACVRAEKSEKYHAGKAVKIICR